MSNTKTKRRKPLVSTNRTRLLSTRMMMMSALKFENVRKSDLFDNDEPLAAVLGPRRHGRLCAELEKEDESDEGPAQFNNVPPNLRSAVLCHLEAFEKTLIAKTRRQQDHLSDNVGRLGRMLGFNRAEKWITYFKLTSIYHAGPVSAMVVIFPKGRAFIQQILQSSSTVKHKFFCSSTLSKLHLTRSSALNASKPLDMRRSRGSRKSLAVVVVSVAK